MNGYSLRQQRKSYFETLRNDIILKSYPQNHYKYFDQYGVGKKIFKAKWDLTLFRLIVNIFLPFAVLLLNLKDFIYAIYRVTVSKRVDTKSIKRLYLEHSRLLFSISKRANLQYPGDVWMRTPSDKFDIPDACQSVCVYDFLSVKNTIIAYWQSILIHIITIFTYGYKYYLLSFKSFEWCLIDFALRNLDDDIELLYANVCDRNAILYDKLPHKKKYMIQHGSMFFYHTLKESPYYTWLEDKKFYVWNSLYKSSPSKVYCLSENDKVALSRSVIANNPEYINIGYGFQPSFIPSRKSVLIVGHYNLHYKDEVFIVNELQGLDIDLYLKNHPTLEDSLYKELRVNHSFLQFIEGRSLEYPKVDVLISYDSTLALEYESIGTRVLYYEDITLSEIRELVRGLLNI